ncbi:MAG: SDR family oxidoreductase [Victivallaceae bacterium]
MRSIVLLVLGLSSVLVLDAHSQDLTIPKRKTIIVTSASGSLGRAVACSLAFDHDLILTGRNFKKLKDLKSELTNSYQGRYEIRSLDFSNPTSRTDFGYYLKNNASHISGVVLITPRPMVNDTESVIPNEDAWLNLFRVNITGPLDTLKTIIPYLYPSSKIVIIAGTTSVQLQPQYGFSCVVFRTWTTLTKILSYRLGAFGITVNALSPGVVLTKAHKERILRQAGENGLSYEEQMRKETENIPLHRHAETLDLTKAVGFLLSDQANFINGINLVLDGGYTSVFH